MKGNRRRAAKCTVESSRRYNTTEQHESKSLDAPVKTLRQLDDLPDISIDELVTNDIGSIVHRGVKTAATEMILYCSSTDGVFIS